MCRTRDRLSHLACRRKLAKAFLDTLRVDYKGLPGYLNDKFDRCYCSACYLATYPDTLDNDGPTPYVVPRGWVRFGLQLGRALHLTFGSGITWNV